MDYVSVCSGLEAATLAWQSLGWKAKAFAEIDPFASQILAHHYPQVRNYGDFTKIQPEDIGPIDLLVGGTPCQDFSVAGLRAGLDGKRGQLTIEFANLAGRLRSRWLVWENVPGVLSSDGGRAFGMFLGILGKLGYGLAYRVLDAQYLGVPQRRRRVFVVGYLGDWRRAAAVLFERHSLSRYPPPSREKRQVTPTIPSRRTAGGGFGTDFDCDGGLVESSGYLISDAPDGSISAKWAKGTGGPAGDECQNLIAHSLRADGFDSIGLDEEQNASEDTMGCLKAREKGGGFEGSVMTPKMAVRRLTPMECERLQGVRDGYTKILITHNLKTGKLLKRPYWAKNGPRYKVLGNSMAVPVMAWIGERIQMVEENFPA